MTQDKDICFTLCAGLGILGCVAFLIFVAYHVWQIWPDISHNKTYPETQRQTGMKQNEKSASNTLFGPNEESSMMYHSKMILITKIKLF